MWYLIFFFKQKTSYEMRISDWSSDVCSSDLHGAAADAACLPVATGGLPARFRRRAAVAATPHAARRPRCGGAAVRGALLRRRGRGRAAAGALRGAAPVAAGLLHRRPQPIERSEEHTSELQSLMRISYAV